MAERTQPTAMDHEYDGIQEFDNPIPGWWHAIFALTILFSLMYGTLWQLTPLAGTPASDWESRQTAEYAKIFSSIGKLEGDTASIDSMMKNSQMMSVAQGIFQSNCAACHAADGGGINGVNLTDEHYKNVKGLADLFAVINRGANNGAMPAWENRIGKNERVILAAYVATLRGTKPKIAKPPEGEVIPAWSVPASAPAAK